MSTKNVMYMKIAGKDYPVYPIGELARRLNRRSQTIRKWENEGIIPKALRDNTGRRVYTLAQIEGIVQAANECNIVSGQSFTDAGFPQMVQKIFERINEEMLQNAEN